MDDIFSDLKESENKEEKNDSNMDWKKSGIDKHERITLKINVQEANAYDAAKPNDLKAKKKVKDNKLTPNGLKRIRKKIRDAIDEEDEDEDENDLIIMPLVEERQDNRLKKALTDEEKGQFARQTFINVRIQQDMVRENAIAQAERILKQAGMKSPAPDIVNKVRGEEMRGTAQEIVREQQKRVTPQKSKPKKVKEQGEKLKSEKEATLLNARQEKNAARTLQQEQAAQAKAEKTLEEIRQKEKTKPDEEVKETPSVQMPERERQPQEKTPQPEKEKELPVEKSVDENTQKLAEDSERQKEQQVKRLILEKSGRTASLSSAENKILKEANLSPEKQKEIEKELKSYQQQRLQQNQGR